MPLALAALSFLAPSLRLRIAGGPLAGQALATSMELRVDSARGMPLRLAVAGAATHARRGGPGAPAPAGPGWGR